MAEHGNIQPSSALRIIVLFLSCSLLMLGGTSSETPPLVVTRFVQGNSEHCSDRGAGSRERPWCHLSAAGRLARPGDIVQIQAGTYQEQMRVLVSGLPDKPIVFTAAPNQKVIIDGRHSQFQEQGLLHIEKQKQVVIRGISVFHSPFYGIQVSNSKNIVLENNEVFGSQHGGIIIDQQSVDIKVLNNDIHGVNAANATGGSGKSIHESITISQTRNFNVEGNHVHQTYKEGIDAKDGSSQGQIHDNHIEHTPAVGVYLNHATQVKVFRNNIHHCSYSGMQLAVGDFAMGARLTAQNDIYQNTIWKNGFNGIQFWQEKQGKLGQNRIFNNVIYANKHSGILLDATQDNIIVNNIIMSNQHHGIRGDAVERNTISHNLFYHNRWDETVGENSLRSDPQFISPEKGNFKLKPTSPAIDHGKNMGLPFSGKAPDLGAWENAFPTSNSRRK